MNSPFEAGMLICFGISWPFSIVKAAHTKVVAGKSPAFMAIVALGYICGIVHKIFFARDIVLILYLINFILVCVDLALYWHYRTTSLTCSSRSADVIGKPRQPPHA